MKSSRAIDVSRALESFFTDLFLIIRNKRGLKISKVLGEYLRLRLTSLVNPTKKEESFCGWKFHFFDYHQFLLFISHGFIHDEYFFETKTKRPFIIDCGANTGDSIVYFKSLYKNSRILAFEPDDITVKVLRQNLQANNLRDVRVETKAVSDASGTTKFYRSAQHPGDAVMSLFEERAHKETTDVSVVRLSDYLHQSVDFLKIDTEGSEGKIIKDLDENRKLKLVKKMVIEYHHHVGGKSNRLSDLLWRLEKNGFDYQLSTELRPPFIAKTFQDVLIFAYI